MIFVAFFLSGAAALIFELTWFHRAGLVFGNTVWATSVVLSAFMAGLGLGNWLAGKLAVRITRFLRVYAVLEITVAASGIAVTLLLPQLDGRLVPLTRGIETRWVVELIHFVTAFTLLGLPAAAMGGTLPMLVAASARPGRQRFGTALGHLYGWNTLGAVVGVIVGELVLVARIGMVGTAVAAGAMNVIAAVIAWSLSRGVFEGGAAHHGTRSPRSASNDSARWRVLACAFLAGAALMALEVIWLRFLSMFVINSTLSISIMLAVVLAAIGIGGLAAGWLVNRQPNSFVHVPALAVIAGFTVAASYVLFQWTTEGTLVADPLRILWFSCMLMFATSCISGALFTLLGAAFGHDAAVEGRAAGWFTLANTAGAAAGPLAATFVLLPLAGIERAFFLLAILYGAIGALALTQVQAAATATSRRVLFLASIASGVTLALFPFGLMASSYFARAAQPYVGDGSHLVASREGTTETIFLMEQSWLQRPVYHRLVTNGFSMSGTHLSGSRYMRSFVYLPMVLHEQPLRRVLVICYGVGVTVGAVTDIDSVESIDVVEVSPDIVAMSDRIYPPDQRPLADRRIKLHIEDGRQFLRVTDQQFDLITGEPPPPLTPGTVNLYTREYFQLIHDRLAEGGIASYWLPIPRGEEYAVSPIIRAFCDVFSDCSLWNGALFDWILVGTRDASSRVSAAAFVKPWTHRVLGPHLREIGFEVPPQIGATFMRDAPALRALTEQTQPLTDNYPRRLREPSEQRARDLVLRQFSDLTDPGRAREAFEQSDFIRRLWPDMLVQQTLPFFDQQRVINRILLEGADPLGHIEELNALITERSLGRLALWVMGSNDVLQRIADSANDASGMVEYLMAQRLLVAANYPVAARYFAESQRLGVRIPAARALEVYAWCLAGRLDSARDRAPTRVSNEASERHFWTWMASRFGVGPLVS